MIKKYIARTIIAITGKAGKRNVFIEFTNTSAGTSYYTTSDIAIQKMIENCEYYKKGLIKSEKLGVRSEELGVRSEELGVRSEELGVRSETGKGGEEHGEITKCVDAIALLRGKYGVTAPLSSKAKIQEAAKELGISFPNL